MGSGKDSGKGADWRTYARYAALTDEELARQCEVQVFRAKGPGGQGVNTTVSRSPLANRAASIKTVASV